MLFRKTPLRRRARTAALFRRSPTLLQHNLADQEESTFFDEETPSFIDLPEPPKIPPPRRFVHRWFFPGFSADVRGGGNGNGSRETYERDSHGPSPAKTAKRTNPNHSNDTTPSDNGVKAKTASPGSPHPSVAETTALSSTGAAATSASPPSEAEETPQRGVGRRVGEEHLPSAFWEHLKKRNTQRKELLMSALGSDFAKVGIEVDSHRVSFSSVSSDAAKRAIGLRRVPHKILVSCLTGPNGSWDWVDVTAHPTAALDEYRDALSQILLDLGTHETIVSDAMEPMLLPQATVMQGCQCLVVRYAVDISGAPFDSFQELTSRFTILITETRIVTIHRTHCAFSEKLRRNWSQIIAGHGGNGRKYLLGLLVKESVDTFNIALTRSMVEFDRYEASLFDPARHRSTLAREIYHIKRRASVYARTLNLIGDSYTHICAVLPILPTDVQFQDVQQDIAHVKSLSEELNANADSVLQLLFQLSSYQLNELMRVLTLFSAFFIPLGFIASIYGMNFTNLPFLEHDYGHMYCIAFMLIVGGGLAGWFKTKRFL